MSALYAYAIAPADGLSEAPVRGLEGRPVRWRRSGALAAAVAALERPPTALIQHLREHDRVVRRLAAGVPAILPLAFGQVFDDEGGLDDCLARRAPRLAAALERVAGCAQATWRVFGTPLSPASAEAEPPVGPGTRYLKERARAAAPDPGVRRALAPLFDALAPLVRAERLEPGRAAPVSAHVYHLVRAADFDAYRSALEAGRELVSPLRLAVGGPHPPYAFAGLDADGG